MGPSVWHGISLLLPHHYRPEPVIAAQLSDVILLVLHCCCKSSVGLCWVERSLCIGSGLLLKDKDCQDLLADLIGCTLSGQSFRMLVV